MKRITVGGAGGFIAGHLAKRLTEQGHHIIAVDRKPLEQWYQLDPRWTLMVADLSDPIWCRKAVDGADEVYQLAASMGGMGWITNERIDCMRNVTINVHMLEAAHMAGVKRYFYSSSACAYNVEKQQDLNVTALKETDAWPAMPERGYGLEKLYSEELAKEYWWERGLQTYIGRFHNCYGPQGTWRGGREKAPAALCRKIAQAVLGGTEELEIWGDGTQLRSYMYVDDCVDGILRVVDEPKLIATPINIGSSQMISVNQMAAIIEKIAGVSLEWKYDPNAPRGVVGRNSDNAFIKEMLNWEPTISFEVGIKATYEWIKRQLIEEQRGGKVVD